MTKTRQIASLVVMFMLCAFFATSVSAQEMGIPDPKRADLEAMKIHQLKNGLKVIFINSKEKKEVDLYLLYKAGTRNEIDSTSGLAHLSEHTMYTGSRNVKPKEHDKLIKEAGGSPNAFTRTDYTLYYDWNMPADKVELALRLEADRMGWPKFDPERFEWEKKALLNEEKSTYKGNVQLSSRLRAIAYERHPYRVGIVEGCHSNAAKLTVEDCKRFHEMYYTPNNAVLVLVGDLDEDATMKLVEKYFGKIKKGPDAPDPIVKEPVQWGVRRGWTKINEVEAPSVSLAFHIPEYSHKDIYSLRVLTNIIYSRWMKMLGEVPEEADKGIAKQISINVESHIDPGLMIISGYVQDIEQGGYTERLLGEVIGDIMKNPPSKQEIENAKLGASMLFARKPLITRPYLSIAEDVGKFALFGDEKYIQNYPDNIMKVTDEDVMNVLKKYIQPSNMTALYVNTDNKIVEQAVEARARVELGYTIKPGPQGMIIKEITPGGAADKAGLKVGDIIYQILAYEVKDIGMYGMVLQYLKSGTKQYYIIRDGKKMTVDITFEWKKQDVPKVWIGVGFEEETAEDGGLVINQIAEGAPAEKAGIKVGDIIIKIGEFECKDFEGLKKAVMSLSPGKVVFVIIRDGKTINVNVELVPRPAPPAPEE